MFRLPYAVLLLALVSLWGASVRAQPPGLSWQGGGCGQDWQIDSPPMALRSILEQLSTVMGFELRYLSQQNPQREGPFRGDARQLLNQLAGRVSLITTGAEDPDCPGRWRPTRVIVLPVGEAGEPRPVVEEVPEGVQLYRRAHGMDPLTGEPSPPPGVARPDEVTD